MCSPKATIVGTAVGNVPFKLYSVVVYDYFQAGVWCINGYLLYLANDIHKGAEYC